jgi:hypothetical protein
MEKAGYTPKMSDAAVKAKTGRNWMGWFIILNKANANAMPHRDVAALLHEKYGVPGWWSQMITVEYERARGGRKKHERPDGFSVGVSKTVAAPLAAAYGAFADAKARAKWFPKGKIEPGKCTPNKYWRAKWNGDARLEVGFYAKAPSKSSPKSQVAVQVSRLSKPSDVETVRAAWKAAVERLARTLSK